MKYNTVSEARKNGIKVRVIHHRLSNDECLGLNHLNWEDIDSFAIPENQVKNFADVSPRGGKTVVEISVPQENGEDKNAFGIAYCSIKDNYNRKTGVSVALGRAFASL